jgi:hypothetical protein
MDRRSDGEGGEDDGESKVMLIDADASLFTFISSIIVYPNPSYHLPVEIVEVMLEQETSGVGSCGILRSCG